MGDTLCAICSYVGQDLKSSDCAAWVQAFGAILAVIAAFLVAYLQNRYEKWREKARARERVTDVITTTIHLAGGVLEIYKKLNQICTNGSASNGVLRLMRLEIGSINRALESTPIWDLKTFEAVENIVTLQSLSATLDELVKFAESQNKMGISWTSYIQGQLGLIGNDLEDRTKRLIAIEASRQGLFRKIRSFFSI